SQIIQKTTGGHKLTETVHHPGTDSPTGCGSNSSYFTTETISTAPLIHMIIDLNGQWSDGGAARPVISVKNNSISIDMSASHRPNALGSLIDSSHISVNFPGDKSYTGAIQQPNTIKWSNNSVWIKVANTIQTVIDLNGKWASGGVVGPVISVSGNSIAV